MFIDANLLVYAIDGSDRKLAVAQKWIAKTHESGDGTLSYQVVQEWFNVVLRKAAVSLSGDEAASIHRQLIERRFGAFSRAVNFSIWRPIFTGRI